MKKTTLDVKGMHCASCSTVVNRALNKVEGVSKSNVNIATNKATIEYDEKKTNIDNLIKIVTSKGYEAKEEGAKAIYDKEGLKNPKSKLIDSVLFLSILYFILLI